MIYKTLKHIDFQAAQELFYNKEVLTAEEAQLVKEFMPKAFINATVTVEFMPVFGSSLYSNENALPET